MATRRDSPTANRSQNQARVSSSGARQGVDYFSDDLDRGSNVNPGLPTPQDEGAAPGAGMTDVPDESFDYGGSSQGRGIRGPTDAGLVGAYARSERDAVQNAVVGNAVSMAAGPVGYGVAGPMGAEVASRVAKEAVTQPGFYGSPYGPEATTAARQWSDIAAHRNLQAAPTIDGMQAARVSDPLGAFMADLGIISMEQSPYAETVPGLNAGGGRGGPTMNGNPVGGAVSVGADGLGGYSVGPDTPGALGTTPNTSSVRAPNVLGAYGGPSGGSGDGGSLGGHSRGAGSMGGYGGGGGAGGPSSQGGFADGGYIGAMEPRRYADGGMMGGSAPMLAMGFQNGGMMGDTGPQNINAQVNQMLRNPQQLQQILGRAQQLMQSGELTPQEVTTMGQIAEACVQNPALYPRLRQFVAEQGMSPLPPAFDPSVLVKILAVSRALQQGGGQGQPGQMGTPPGQIPPTDQAQMQPPAGMRDGGMLRGPGDGRSDSIGTVNTSSGQPVKVANGEYVIPEHVVRAKGRDFFDKLLRQYANVTPGGQS